MTQKSIEGRSDQVLIPIMYEIKVFSNQSFDHIFRTAVQKSGNPVLDHIGDGLTPQNGSGQLFYQVKFNLVDINCGKPFYIFGKWDIWVQRNLYR